MKFLKKLLGLNTHVTEHEVHELAKKTTEKFLAGESISGSVGVSKNQIYSSSRFHKSKSSEYKVLWTDGFGGENNHWINGIIALKRQNETLFEMEIARPFECKVTNSGTVVCNDSTLNSLEYSKNSYCKFWIVNAYGRVITSYELTANIGDTFEVSDDGAVAVFNTLNSKTDDASCVFVFDLLNGTLIEKVELAEGELCGIKFDRGNKTVIVELEDDDCIEVNYDN